MFARIGKTPLDAFENVPVKGEENKAEETLPQPVVKPENNYYADIQVKYQRGGERGYEYCAFVYIYNRAKQSHHGDPNGYVDNLKVYGDSIDAAMTRAENAARKWKEEQEIIDKPVNKTVDL